jgi:hypothetical protein
VHKFSEKYRSHLLILDTKKVPFWGSTDIKRQRKKFTYRGDPAPWICVPLSKIVNTRAVDWTVEVQLLVELFVFFLSALPIMTSSFIRPIIQWKNLDFGLFRWSKVGWSVKPFTHLWLLSYTFWPYRLFILSLHEIQNERIIWRLYIVCMPTRHILHHICHGGYFCRQCRYNQLEGIPRNTATNISNLA